VDFLLGQDGDDTLNGGDGNDTLNGGLADGGLGADRLQGEDGADLLNGGGDNDTLEGGADNDTLNGGTGDDILNGQAGDNAMNGGAGADTLTANGGADQINGGADIDALITFWSADTVGVTLAAGVDAPALPGGRSVIGIERFANLQTGSGNDILTTSLNRALSDTIDSGGGNDTVTVLGAATSGVTGADVVHLGSGADTLVVDYGSAIEQVIMTTPTAGVSGGSGQIFLENLIRLTYTGADRVNVTGGAADDYLKGGNGDDTLNGGGGDDIIRIGVGADRADGGAGIEPWRPTSPPTAAPSCLPPAWTPCRCPAAGW